MLKQKSRGSQDEYFFEYDEEREIELIRRDEREIGEQIGKEIGQEIGARKERQNTQKILKEERRKAQQELDKKSGECYSINDFSLPEIGWNKRAGNRRITGKLWSDQREGRREGKDLLEGMSKIISCR